MPTTRIIPSIWIATVVACGSSPSQRVEPFDASAPTSDAGRDSGSGVADAGARSDAGKPTDAGASKVDGGAAAGDAGLVVPSCGVDLSDRLDAIRVPGLSAGIVKGGQLVCTAVAGVADVDTNAPVSSDTVFEWASVSKTVVAAATMILVEQGRLGLDDVVSTHLPFEVRNPSCANTPMTIRQLMTHRSSILDADGTYDATYTTGDSPIPLGTFLRDYLVPGRMYYDARDNFANGCPGTSTEYSNVAVALLGYVVEHVSGVGFDGFCRQHIFEPLGMTQTSFHLAELDLSMVAVSHERTNGGFRSIGHVGYATFPDGLLRTSVPHLARFLAMVAEGGHYNGVRILESASVDEMLRIQSRSAEPTQALVWFTQAFPGRPLLIGHDGSDDGAASYMFFDPTDGVGVLLVTNADWWGDRDDAPAADALVGDLFIESARH